MPFVPTRRGLAAKDDGWRIPDALWEKLEPLLPPPERRHPLGCHNPRVPNRNAMNAILFVVRTGCHWDALNSLGICSSSSAHRRFVEWSAAGVFDEFWKRGLLRHGEKSSHLRLVAMGGTMTPAAIVGLETQWPQPRKEGKKRRQRIPWEYWF